jgi:hypothetical protein
MFRPHELDALLTTFGPQHLIASLAQDEPDIVNHIWIILNAQYLGLGHTLIPGLDD